MRKAFNFYASYWEQMKLLNDKQKVLLFDAICSVQFLEVNIKDIEFKDQILKIVWAGVKHSVSTSLNGFLSKQKALDKDKTTPLSAPLSKGLSKEGIQQEKVQVQEEVQEEVQGKGKEETIDFEKVVDVFHLTCTKLSKVKKITAGRKTAIRARIKEYSKNQIVDVFDLISKSNFLNGENDRNWKADFDWIFNQANFTKIIEGKYENKEVKQVIGMRQL